MKNNIIKDFNLPSYIKGKSFAEASKLIDKKFKDRNDKASLETKNDLLTRLSKAQEYIKMQQALANNASQVPDQMNGQIPNGMQQFFEGGPIDFNAGNQGAYSTPDGELVDPLGQMGEQSGPGVGAYVGAATTAIDLGKTAFGKTGIDTSGATQPGQTKAGESALSGAAKGAQAGMMFGPWGAAIGGVVGGVAGFIGGNKRKKEESKAAHNFTLGQNANFRQSDFAFGGEITDPSNPTEPVYSPLNKSQLNNFNKNSNVQFTQEGADRLGLSTVKYSGPKIEDLNLGKYKDLNYFDISTNGDEYIVNPTKNNPHGPDTYKDVIKYLQTQNPNSKFARQNYIAPSNRMAMGGYTNKYDGITNPTGFLKPDEEFNDKLGFPISAGEKYGLGQGSKYYKPSSVISNLQGTSFNPEFAIPSDSEISKKVNSKINTESTLPKANLQPAVDWAKENYGSLLRYAPIVGNLTNKLKPSVTPRGNRLDNTYKPQLFDEATLINQINQQNVDRALTEASGGDLGALRTNLLAANLNKTKALSEGMIQGQAINRDENRFAFQSGMQRDSTNAQLEERYIERKAQDEGAFNTAKQAQRNALFEDIGKIGKEEVNKKLVKEMFGYTWNGKYFVDKEGNEYTSEDVKASIKSLKEQKEAAEKAQKEKNKEVN